MPEALRRRHRLRVEGALDERQQRQLGRHAALVELLDDVEQVAAAALGHARHVVGPGRVPLLAVAHQVVVEVGHREAAAHALPQVDAGGAVVEVEAHLGAQRIDRHRRGDRRHRASRRRPATLCAAAVVRSAFGRGERAGAEAAAAGCGAAATRRSGEEKRQPRRSRRRRRSGPAIHAKAGGRAREIVIGACCSSRADAGRREGGSLECPPAQAPCGIACLRCRRRALRSGS